MQEESKVRGGEGMFKKAVTSSLVALAMLPVMAAGEAATPGSAADTASAKTMVQHQAVQEGVEETHQRAIELSRAGKMNEALVLLQELSQRQGVSDAVWYDYLTVLQWSGNNKATIDIFQQRYGGKEDAVPGFVLRSLGGAYYQLEDFEKSQRYYTWLWLKASCLRGCSWRKPLCALGIRRQGRLCMARS